MSPYENIATTLHNHISVYYTDVIIFSDFIRYPIFQCPDEIHAGEYPGEENGKKKNLKNLSPEMANILIF